MPFLIILPTGIHVIDKADKGTTRSSQGNSFEEERPNLNDIIHRSIDKHQNHQEGHCREANQRSTLPDHLQAATAGRMVVVMMSR